MASASDRVAELEQRKAELAGRWQEVSSDRKKAQAALDEQQIDAWLDEARERIAAGAFDEARQRVHRALELDPKSAAALRARRRSRLHLWPS